MTLKLPKSKKFPRKIPKEEIQEKVNEEMKQKGTSNYFQAKLYHKMTKEVIGSKEHKFCTLQSKPKESEEESWLQAYEFVYDFLQKHDMKLTLKTIDYEFYEGNQPILVHTFENFSREEYFKELQNISKTLEEHSFQERVKVFSTLEGL